MSIVSRRPRDPRLVGLVETLWHASAEPVPTCHVEWILPTCRAQLILAPESSILIGPRSRPEGIERSTDVATIGVSLAASATKALARVDASELLDTSVPLDSLVDVGSLTDRLFADNARQALDAVEAEIAGWIQLPVGAAAVLGAERALRNGVRVSDVASLLGVDRRNLVPDFRRFVGVGLKHYERICRFNRSIEAIRRRDASPLASIAADSGYADQAHLTREVRHFAGISPARLHRDGAAMVNHVEADKIFKT